MNHTPVTPADIEACIASESYFTAADGVTGASIGKPGASLLPEYVTAPGWPLSLLTFCVLITQNGHTVTGEAHCQDPAKFNTEIGRAEARKDAINKLWPMVVYAARQQVAPAVRRPYAWADVASYRTNERTFDGMTEFSIHMHDGRTYGGAMPSGLRWPDASAAMLAECNRQRDQAPE
jgi:hypothetical protein